ncbi:MAG: hypothetical protein H6618_06095 [Deltaproteobacteria bacterium]|nr:hypothetical protein [Deltaproteobacteria bacterium]
MYLINNHFFLIFLSGCLSCLGILHAEECGEPYVVFEQGLEVRDAWGRGVEGQAERSERIIKYWEHTYTVTPPPCTPQFTYEDLRQVPDVSTYSDAPPAPDLSPQRSYQPSDRQYPDQSYQGSIWDGVECNLTEKDVKRLYSGLMEDLERNKRWHMTANISQDCTTEESRKNRAKAKEVRAEIDTLSEKKKQTEEKIARQKILISQKQELVARFAHYREKRLAAEKKIQEMDFPDRRQNIIDVSREVARDALDLAKEKETEDALFGIGLAETVLDLATSLTPGVSWVRDVYESISGRHLITGEDLSATERLMASAGALSAGLGSKVGKFAKIVDRLGMGADATGIIHKAEKVYDSAKNWGLKPDQVKGFANTLKLSGLELSHAKKALSVAREPYKGSTRLAHALHKHQGTAPGRKPHLWGDKLKGAMNTWHDQAMKHYREIFTGPGKFEKVADPKTGIQWLEKRLPDGRGIRLQQDGAFKGFVD